MQGEVEIVPSADAAADGPGVLPSFVTPDWLARNHHLMKADLRKLAGWLAEEYAEWPSAADGGDAAAFWRAAHALAGRWTQFLRLFEDRIVETFGGVKGSRKRLTPRLLHSAGERARELRPLARGEAEPAATEDLETLFAAGEREMVAAAVWALTCLEEPDGRYPVSSWLEEPEIDALVGESVRRMRTAWRADRADLVERLVRGEPGPHLDRLVARAADECAALDRDLAETWSVLRTFIAGQESYRHEAADAVSGMLFDVDMLSDERDEIASARDGTVARCRHAALPALLMEAIDRLRETGPGEAADRLRADVRTLARDEALPILFPDADWERCRETAARFRAAIVEPGEKELALRAASRRYGEEPSAANLEALHEAAAAERTSPRSLEPATAALGEIAACLEDLVGRFGSMADLARAAEDAAARTAEPPGRAPRAEIADARAAVRDAEARILELTAALEAAGEENDALRREKHRLGERLAALEAGSYMPAAEDAVPPLGSYADLPEWTERHFAGRVALAGRALRALKSARFEDVELVGKAVALLGTTYRRMKTEGGRELREAFEAELRGLRLQETPSISPDRQGKARDDFEIEWEGRRLTLDRHLKNKAKTRDPRQCLRIYFAWDEAARQVVIGHLPGHMRT